MLRIEMSKQKKILILNVWRNGEYAKNDEITFIITADGGHIKKSTSG